MNKTCANCKHWDRPKMVTGLEYSSAPCKNSFQDTNMAFPDGYTCSGFKELPIRGKSLMHTVIEIANKLKRDLKAVNHIDMENEKKLNSGHVDFKRKAINKITLNDKVLKIDLKLHLNAKFAGNDIIHYIDLTEDLEPELFSKITDAVSDSMNKQMETLKAS